jgi:hypothetical protein
MAKWMISLEGRAPKEGTRKKQLPRPENRLVYKSMGR